MITATDVERCPDGMAHSWVYLGKGLQLYRCGRCAQTATKKDVKAATEQEVTNVSIPR